MEPMENEVILSIFVEDTFWKQSERGKGMRSLLGTVSKSRGEWQKPRNKSGFIGGGTEGRLEEGFLRCDGQICPVQV